MSSSVLVLNPDYQAIGVANVERAFVLVYLGKAELISDIPGKSLRTIQRDFQFPSIIRLYKYVYLPYRKVNLTRHNIFRRDNSRCLYCGTREELTLDHVLPRARGGKDTWENLATACRRCNNKKGDLTPDEAGMTLRTQPFRPSFVMFLGNFNGTVREDWKPYLYLA